MITQTSPQRGSSQVKAIFLFITTDCAKDGGKQMFESSIVPLPPFFFWLNTELLFMVNAMWDISLIFFCNVLMLCVEVCRDLWLHFLTGHM